MISEISEGTDPGSQDTVRASKEASDPQLEIQVVTPENLANLRHELRGPINHIIGYSEMLEEEVRDLGKEDFIPDLQRIQVAGRQLLSITNDFLDQSTVENDRVNLGRMRHELRAPVNAVITCAEMLEGKVQVQCQEGLVSDLQKICLAAKQLVAFVNDPMANLEISKSSSRQLDSSKSGMDSSAGSTPISRDRKNGDRPKNGSGSILVVDDNVNNRDMLSRRLERKGHEVAQAANGPQALEMIKTNVFDLVLLDIMMPEMDGYQVLEHLKGDDTLRHVPVIMLSALDEVGSAVRCIELGAEDYLSKPFNPVLLRARIDASLEKKRLHDQELQYQQQLEEISSAKSQILSTVSHELKTPLTGIISQVYLLLMRQEQVGPINDRQHKHLETIQRNSFRLKALIDDLLDISRIESGSLELTFEELQVRREIEDVVEAMEGQISEKQIDVALNIPPNLMILADKLRFSQVVTNLLSNACKYSPVGSAATIRATETEHGIQIDVADSGIGMSKSDLLKLFTKFFRADNSSTRKVR